jgi:pyruvate,orthophosphate dikinase
MFFEPDRIFAFRQMIVSSNVEQRRKALEKILPMQRGDFEGLFTEMKGYPVTIRLLDPPLHEFLPQDDEDIAALAKELGILADDLKSLVKNLHELNPMMGHRGCRLAVSYPEIAEMQTRAIIEAAINVNKKGMSVIPEIMIPLVCDVKELKYVKDIIVRTADAIIASSGTSLKYMVGTMIEIPRAALLADEIAVEAEFFSFGTNDLTQMTYGLSRDDAGRILDDYYQAKIFEADPTAKLDLIGVGRLMKMASELGKKTRPDIKLGICGEHGGDPSSVEFCHRIGLNYVSCSPFRVPIARLAAAHAVVKKEGDLGQK